MARKKRSPENLGRFIKGHTPWNKGLKGTTGFSPTRFKTGDRPANWMPVGTERIVEGYIEVKIGEPRTWRSKHRIIWERKHGPVPGGHVVIFADGNPRNFRLDNLLLVTRGELATLNRWGLIFPDAKLTLAGLQIARIKQAIRRRSGNEQP